MYKEIKLIFLIFLSLSLLITPSAVYAQANQQTDDQVIETNGVPNINNLNCSVNVDFEAEQNIVYKGCGAARCNAFDGEISSFCDCSIYEEENYNECKINQVQECPSELTFKEISGDVVTQTQSDLLFIAKSKDYEKIKLSVLGDSSFDEFETINIDSLPFYEDLVYNDFKNALFLTNTSGNQKELIILLFDQSYMYSARYIIKKDNNLPSMDFLSFEKTEIFSEYHHSELRVDGLLKQSVLLDVVNLKEIGEKNIYFMLSNKSDSQQLFLSAFNINKNLSSDITVYGDGIKPFESINDLLTDKKNEFLGMINNGFESFGSFSNFKNALIDKKKEIGSNINVEIILEEEYFLEELDSIISEQECDVFSEYTQFPEARFSQCKFNNLRLNIYSSEIFPGRNVLFSFTNVYQDALITEEYLVLKNQIESQENPIYYFYSLENAQKMNFEDIVFEEEQFDRLSSNNFSFIVTHGEQLINVNSSSSGLYIKKIQEVEKESIMKGLENKRFNAEVFLVNKDVDDDAQTGNRIPASDNSNMLYLLLWVDDRVLTSGNIQDYSSKSLCSDSIGPNQKIEELNAYIRSKSAIPNTPYYNRLPLSIRRRAVYDCEFVIDHPQKIYGGLKEGAWDIRSDELYVIEVEALVSVDGEGSRNYYYSISAEDELRFHSVSEKVFDEEAASRAAQSSDKIEEVEEYEEKEIVLFQSQEGDTFFGPVYNYGFLSFEFLESGNKKIGSCFFNNQQVLDDCRLKGGSWYNFAYNPSDLLGLTKIDVSGDWINNYEERGYFCAIKNEDSCGEEGQRPCVYGCKNELSSCMGSGAEGVCLERCNLLSSTFSEVDFTGEGFSGDAIIYDPELEIVIDSIIINDDSHPLRIQANDDMEFFNVDLSLIFSNLNYDSLIIDVELVNLEDNIRQKIFEPVVLPYIADSENELGFSEFRVSEEVPLKISMFFENIEIPITYYGEHKLLVTISQGQRQSSRFWYRESPQSGLIIIEEEADIEEVAEEVASLEDFFEIVGERIDNDYLTPEEETKLERVVSNYINTYVDNLETQNLNDYYEAVVDFYELIAELGGGIDDAARIRGALVSVTEDQKRRIIQELEQVVTDMLLFSNILIYSDALGAVSSASQAIYGGEDDPSQRSGWGVFWQVLGDIKDAVLVHPTKNLQDQWSDGDIEDAIKYNSFLFETLYRDLAERRLSSLATNSNFNQEIRNPVLLRDVSNFSKSHLLINNIYSTPAVLHDAYNYVDAAKHFFHCDNRIPGMDEEWVRFGNTISSNNHLDACEYLYADKVNKFYAHEENFNEGYPAINSFFNSKKQELERELELLSDEGKRMRRQLYDDILFLAIFSFITSQAITMKLKSVSSASSNIGVRVLRSSGFQFGAGAVFLGILGSEVYQHYVCFTKTRYEKEDLYRKYQDKYDLRTETDLLSRCRDQLVLSVAVFGSGILGGISGIVPRPSAASRVVSKNVARQIASASDSLPAVKLLTAPPTKVIRTKVLKPAAGTMRGPAGTWKLGEKAAVEKFQNLYLRGEFSRVFDGVDGSVLIDVSRVSNRGKVNFMRNIDNIYAESVSNMRRFGSQGVISESQLKRIIRPTYEASLRQRAAEAKSYVNTLKYGRKELTRYVDDVVDDLLRTFDNVFQTSSPSPSISMARPAASARQTITLKADNVKITPLKQVKPKPQQPPPKKPAEAIRIGRGAISNEPVKGHGGVVQDQFYVNPSKKVFAVADGVTGAGADSREAARILARGDPENNIVGLADELATLYARYGVKNEGSIAKIYDGLKAHLHKLDAFITKTYPVTETRPYIPRSTVNVGMITDEKKLLMFTLGDVEARILRNKQIYHLDQFFTNYGEDLFYGAPTLSKTDPRFIIKSVGSTVQAESHNSPFQAGAGLSGMDPHLGVYKLRPGDRLVFSSDGLSKVANPGIREADFAGILKSAKNPTDAETGIFNFVDKAMKNLVAYPDDISLVSVFID